MDPTFNRHINFPKCLRCMLMSSTFAIDRMLLTRTACKPHFIPQLIGKYQLICSLFSGKYLDDITEYGSYLHVWLVCFWRQRNATSFHHVKLMAFFKNSLEIRRITKREVICFVSRCAVLVNHVIKLLRYQEARVSKYKSFDHVWRLYMFCVVFLFWRTVHTEF